MSGGYFNNNQFRIMDTADEIESFIKMNDEAEINGYVDDYTDETINELKKALIILRKAFVYVERVDFLVSGDDSEADFHKRLKEDLEDLK